MPIQKVTSGIIADGAIVATDIADGTVTGPKLGANSVSSNNIIAGVTLTTPIVSGNLNLDTAGTTGIRVPAANTITFHTAGTEDMRIDATGNVGIGTTNPAAVSGFTSSRRVLQVTNSGYGQLILGGSSGTLIDHDDDGNTITTIRNRYGASSASARMNLESGFISFGTGTSYTERMRITSTGRLCLGTTTAPYAVYFKLSGDSGDWFAKFENTSADPYGLYIHYANAAPNNAGREFFYLGDSSAARMYVYSNGGIANYSGNNVNLSDEREKTNIQLAGSYLDKICAIPVKTFNYIDQNREEDDGLTLGVIAQDVQAVAPELVLESNWAAKDEPEKIRLSVYQTDLTFALMKCIQEQQAMIEELKTKVTALENANK